MSGDYFISWLVKGEKGGKLNDVLHKNALLLLLPTLLLMLRRIFRYEKCCSFSRENPSLQKEAKEDSRAAYRKCATDGITLACTGTDDS